ncbi:MAG: phage tail tip lysozyme [Clostridia bacterium]
MNENEEKKDKDAIEDAARNAKNKTVKKIKRVVITKLTSFIALILAKLLPIILISALLCTLWEWLIEVFQSEDTPNVIYASLLDENNAQSKNLASLIEIKGDQKNGYYLDFKDNIDEKIDNTINELNKLDYTAEALDKDLLKKIIKAELITQYPNLGGKIANGTDQFQGAIKIRRITPNKSYGEVKNAASGEVTKQNITYSESDTVGENTEGEKIYTIGIMAAYSKDSPGATSPTPEAGEQQLKEEELAIKVAKYVEQAFGIYGNIKVVQIGSTEDNPNVPNDERLQKAKDANVDVLIGIAFNSSGDGKSYNNKNGVGITYNQDGGSDETKKLGNILKKSVSSSMDINIDDFDSEDKSNTLGTKDDKFLSLTINGGYLTSKKDYAILSQDYGLQQYAKGVVNGVLSYYGIENKGYGTMIDGTSSISTTVESKVIDLKYVPLDQFENDITNNPEKALEEFSLDENYKLVTATWNYSEGTLTVTKNTTSLDYKSVLSKYTMPMEYLLSWYIDTQNKEFVTNLAQLAIDSEFVIMLEDNISTTRTITTKEEASQTQQEDQNGEYSINVENVDLHQTDKDTKVTERVSSKLELIYADTWFVKFDNKLLLEQTSKNIQKANGTVTQNDSAATATSVNTDEWSEKETKTQTRVEDDGTEVTEEVEVTKNYKKETTTQITTETTSISNEYKAGESQITGNEQKFVKLYKNYPTEGWLTLDWLIGILEDNSKTANLVDITKYLVYKASGEDTGVITFDFSEYAPKSFNTSTGIYGGTIQEKVWFALRDLGYSEISVAGAMGNIHWESGGFNPSLIEGGSGEGIGLIQWSFGRKEGLINYANSKGVSWQDEDTQIEYLVTEITGEGKAVGYATYQFMNAHGYSADDWENASDIKTATEAFCWCFERPNAEKAHVAEREQFANEYYADFQGKTKPSGSSTSAEGDGYTQIYTASSGKQYREYKQYEGSYKDTLYMPYGEPISSIGCSLTAIAISLTGYGVDVNPGDLAGHNYLSQHFEDYGVSCSRGSATADNITDHLNEGKPVVVEISGTLVTAEGTKYYGQHFIALIDINSDGDVYVSDPGSTVSNGWAKVNDIVNISKSALYAEN